jgi:hypothetical protein
MSERFDVWVWFPEGLHHRVGEGLEAEAAVRLASDYSRRPAARFGIIREIRIVDGGDDTVFEWRYGEGVTFPPRNVTPPEAA